MKALRISSRADWIDRHFRGLARRSNELPCPTRWDIVVECAEDLLPFLRRLRRTRPLQQQDPSHDL